MSKAETQAKPADGGTVEFGPTAESLVRDHSAAVLGVCLAHTKNLHDSEDIMQEVFLKAFSKLHTLRQPGKVRGWLLQITRRACIDHHRRGKNNTRQLPDDVPARPPHDDHRAERLHRAISKLPENYREAIALYYLNGRSSAVVAETLGITLSAVRSRMARARLLLHEILREDSL
ncbi:MAG: RNA polymerase sigma factor [Planctomycetota bacterium]